MDRVPTPPYVCLHTHARTRSLANGAREAAFLRTWRRRRRVGGWHSRFDRAASRASAAILLPDLCDPASAARGSGRVAARPALAYAACCRMGDARAAA